MRILWHSNASWTASGYGQQTALWAPRLHREHPVTISAFHGLQSGVLPWQGMKVLPAGQTPFGNDVMGRYAAAEGCDVVISLIDIWVLDRSTLPDSIAWVPHYPVDHDPIPERVLAHARHADLSIAMSQFGLAQMAQAGLDAVYVPHAFDPDQFYPDTVAAEAFRRAVGVPDDGFLVTIVAANQGGYPSRKSYPQMIEALGLFMAENPKAWLYVHAYDGQDGQLGAVPLTSTFQRFGLDPERVRITDQYAYRTGQLPTSWLRAAYSASNVLLNVSAGEGFGIPILEAQACGCPVIVGGWTAMRELCWSGWMLDPETEADRYLTPQESYWWLPRPAAIHLALREAYEMRDNGELRETATRLAQDYAADHVYETNWKPALARIQEAIDRRRGQQAPLEVEIDQVDLDAIAARGEES